MKRELPTGELRVSTEESHGAHAPAYNPADVCVVTRLWAADASV